MQGQQFYVNHSYQTTASPSILQTLLFIIIQEDVKNLHYFMSRVSFHITKQNLTFLRLEYRNSTVLTFLNTRSVSDGYQKLRQKTLGRYAYAQVVIQCHYNLVGWLKDVLRLKINKIFPLSLCKCLTFSHCFE